MAEPADTDDARTAALAETLLREAADEITRADEKASLLIGSLGIMFSIVLSGILGGHWSPADLSPFGMGVWSLGVLISAASLVSGAIAVWPRLSKPPKEGAITFWGHVRGLDSPQEVAEALRTRGLQPPLRTFQQLQVLSAVVQHKYRSIRWAMALAGIGIALVAWGFQLSA